MCHTNAADDEVLFNEIGNKAILTLNRPKALNALTENMVNAMYPVLKKWEKSMKIVIVKGAGEKAFCAGGDVVAVTEPARRNSPDACSFFKTEYTLNHLIGTYNVPYVSFINGIVMGGGCGVSVNGRYRVASERSLFAMPETAIGLFPDVGGSHFLPRLGGGLGMFLALTGHRLRGADLVRAGVATHLVPQDRIEELERALLALPANTARPHVEGVLQAFSQPVTEFSLAPHLKEIKRCFTQPTLQEILDCLEKSEDEFCRKQWELISRMCPTSVVITHEQLRRGKELPLHECLNMEYRMVKRVMQRGDFAEGVRARLVDKDNSPRWDPASLAEVDALYTLAKHFAPLPDEEELGLKERSRV